MLTVIISGIVVLVMMLVLYLAPAILLHPKCDLPGSDCIKAPTVLAWLFWGERRDHLRDPFGIFVQAGSIIGAILTVVTMLTPLEMPNRRLLVLAIFVAPFIVIALMNLTYQVIRKLRA